MRLLRWWLPLAFWLIVVPLMHGSVSVGDLHPHVPSRMGRGIIPGYMELDRSESPCRTFSLLLSHFSFPSMCVLPSGRSCRGR
jgi:hypothetical protein